MMDEDTVMPPKIKETCLTLAYREVCRLKLIISLKPRFYRYNLVTQTLHIFNS